MSTDDEKVEEKSLADYLGMTFNEDGTWTSKDAGKSNVFYKMNRKQRRKNGIRGNKYKSVLKRI